MKCPSNHLSHIRLFLCLWVMPSSKEEKVQTNPAGLLSGALRMRQQALDAADGSQLEEVQAVTQRIEGLMRELFEMMNRRYPHERLIHSPLAFESDQ